MKEINLPPFYVEQRVVANCNHYELKNGSIYTVIVIRRAACCKSWEVYVGIDSKFSLFGYESVCAHCKKTTNDGHDERIFYLASRFAPITENFQSISLEKVLEEETKLIGVN